METDISTTTETSVEDNSSAYESNIGSGNVTETDLFSGNSTGIDTTTGFDTDIASNNAALAGLDAFWVHRGTPLAGIVMVPASRRAYR